MVISAVVCKDSNPFTKVMTYWLFVSVKISPEGLLVICPFYYFCETLNRRKTREVMIIIFGNKSSDSDFDSSIMS